MINCSQMRFAATILIVLVLKFFLKIFNLTDFSSDPYNFSSKKMRVNRLSSKGIKWLSSALISLRLTSFYECDTVLRRPFYRRLVLNLEKVWTTFNYPLSIRPPTPPTAVKVGGAIFRSIIKKKWLKKQIFWCFHYFCLPWLLSSFTCIQLFFFEKLQE